MSFHQQTNQHDQLPRNDIWLVLLPHITLHRLTPPSPFTSSDTDREVRRGVVRLIQYLLTAIRIKFFTCSFTFGLKHNSIFCRSGRRASNTEQTGEQISTRKTARRVYAYPYRMSMTSTASIQLQRYTTLRCPCKFQICNQMIISA